MKSKHTNQFHVNFAQLSYFPPRQSKHFYILFIVTVHHQPLPELRDKSTRPHAKQGGLQSASEPVPLSIGVQKQASDAYIPRYTWVCRSI